MEVKPGHKQTDAGVIPKDWDLEYVENLAHITTGSRNTQDRVNDGQYPFFVRSQKVERINSYSFDGEAVLTAGDGVGTGKVFHYINGRFDAHQRVYRISDFGERVNGYFFYLYFSSRFYNRIMQMTAKSSVDSVRRDMIARMLIPLPPTRAEQEAIAEALSDADALIESLEQLLAKKRQIKQGAMQELLTGKKRLPGFETKSGYKQTEVRVIPEDWLVRPLGELVTFLDSQRRPVKDADRAKMRGTVPYYGASGIVDYVNDYLFDEDLILLGEDGENILSRTCRLAFRISGKAWVNNHAHVLRPNPDISIGFLTDSLESLNYEQFNSGTAQPKLNRQTCSRILVALPPVKAEQEAIAIVLADMDAEISALEAKLAKARQVKQGMMQELLTGRIRLV